MDSAPQDSRQPRQATSPERSQEEAQTLPARAVGSDADARRNPVRDRTVRGLWWWAATPGGWALSVVLLAAVLIARWGPWWHPFFYFIDLDVYRSGGEAVLNGLGLYNQDYEVATGNLPFTYPPLSGLIFVPFALLPLTAASAVLLVINVALTWWVTAVAVRAVFHVPASLSRGAGLAATPFLLFLEPVSNTLAYGQINLVLMALVMADLLLPRTRWPRGLLIGLAAAIKLTPAVFGLYFLLRRDWKGTAVTVASGVGFTLLAAALRPSDSWQYWFTVLRDPSRIGGLAYSANQSLRGMVARLLPETTQQAAWLVLALVAAALVIVAMLRLLAVGNIPAAVAANSLLALLASPVSWSHHWVWFILLLVVCASQVGAPRRSAACQVLLTTGLLLGFGGLHWQFPSSNDQELHWTVWQHIFGSSYVLWAVAFLLVAALSSASLRPQRGTVAPTQPGAVAAGERRFRSM